MEIYRDIKNYVGPRWSCNGKCVNRGVNHEVNTYNILLTTSVNKVTCHTDIINDVQILLLMLKIKKQCRYYNFEN